MGRSICCHDAKVGRVAFLLAICLSIITSGFGQEKRTRAFILEGDSRSDPHVSNTRAPVTVIRNGQSREMYPGDELLEGDRVVSGGPTRKKSEGGGGIAIYDESGEPLAIVSNIYELDITISNLGKDTRKYDIPNVGIVNNSQKPPDVEIENRASDGARPTINVRKTDGTPERRLTPAELEQMDREMGFLDARHHPWRWERAGRIITEGEKGADKEYSQMQAEKDKNNKTEAACGVGDTWTEEESGYSAIWTRQANSDIFNALFTAPDGSRPTTRNRVALRGSAVIVDRLSSTDSHLCEYSGTLVGEHITGTYRCPSAWPGTREWSATVSCKH